MHDIICILVCSHLDVFVFVKASTRVGKVLNLTRVPAILAVRVGRSYYFRPGPVETAAEQHAQTTI